MKSVLVVYGTRPEAIKCLPVVRELRRREGQFRVTVCSTGQHNEMLAQVHDLWGLPPDLELGLMKPQQSLNALCSRLVAALDRVLEEVAPDWVVVQGDTTSAMAGALAAFHREIPLAHIEAGLRTYDLTSPFPEEANRRVIDLLATLLFAPTPRAARLLAREGTAQDRIFVTGNTVVDALMEITSRLELGDRPPARQVLITLHRRESFGDPLRGVLTAIRRLALKFPGWTWTFPLHPNPNVRGPASQILGDLPNLHLVPALDYGSLVRTLHGCHLVLTDSGGLQEEAPILGLPVLVLRNTTERPEGLEAGTAKLVGTDPERIVCETSRLIEDPEAHREMARSANPYGDGYASQRIASLLAGESVRPFTPVSERARPESLRLRRDR